MRGTYEVKMTVQAQRQMKEIIHYIKLELKAPEAALHLLDSLEKAISSLTQFPHRIPLTDEQPWRKNGVHKMSVKNFFVYFWIDEENKKVQVTAVVYFRRNQLRQLTQMDME